MKCMNKLVRFSRNPYASLVRYNSCIHDQSNIWKTIQLRNKIHSFQRNFSLTSREHFFRILELKSFNDIEIQSSFQNLHGGVLDGNQSINVSKSLRNLVQTPGKEYEISEKQLIEVTHMLTNRSQSNDVLTLAEYGVRVKELGEALDPRVYNIGFSFLLTGISVGIVIPCMPLIVKQLELPPYEFGLVISAFALSKLLGNIPAGYLVEKYGRKPIMLGGLGMCGIGIGFIGFALTPGLGTPWLMFCRLITGLGVSAFTAGGFMYMSDISTALNRTRTISPVMAAFSCGAALGPAVGGFLIGAVGITNTYVIVGGLIGVQTLINSYLLSETKIETTTKLSPFLTTSDESISTLLSVTMKEWKDLWRNVEIRRIVSLNCAYWFAYSGSQMTLLPLLLTSSTFHLNAYEIGGCFAFMSIASVLASQPSAYFADKVGKVPSILGGCGLIASSLIALPFASNLTELVVLLLPLSLGSTVLSSSPTALLSDLTTSEQRAQALSFLRTAGDVGFLTGALFSGSLADVITVEGGILANGGMMVLTILWYYSLVSRAIPPKANSKIP